MSLRTIVTGTAFASAASVTRILAQFIVVPILSRLLTSADYGLVGIASPFVFFAMLIADAGVGMSLVRSAPVEDTVSWSTSFWLVLLLGSGLALILVAFAPLAAHVFGEPKLEPILIILSYTVVAQAAAIIPGAALQQAQRFSTIAAVEMSSTLLGIIAVVIAGLLGAGVWALIAQQVVFFTSRSLLTFIYSPFRPHLTFNLPKIKSHVAFGRDVIGASAIAQLVGSIDNLVIGHVLGSSAVGFYAMAMQFIRLPTIVVAGPLQFVLFSHMAAIKDNLPAIRRTFLLVTRVLGIIIFPSLGMVATAHFSFFNILLSEKWSEIEHDLHDPGHGGRFTDDDGAWRGYHAYYGTYGPSLAHDNRIRSTMALRAFAVGFARPLLGSNRVQLRCPAIFTKDLVAAAVTNPVSG